MTPTAATAAPALAVLLLFGGSPPAGPQPAMGSPLTNIVSSASQVVMGQAQPSRTPEQMEPMRFVVLRVQEREEPEVPV